MIEFSVRFHSSLGNVKAAESLWNACLEGQPLTPEKRYWLSLSIHELAVNAIVHGNHEDKSKWVTVEIERKGSLLEVRVADQGEQERAPEILDPTLDGNLFKDHGRGLYIVQHNVDHMDFRLSPRVGLEAVVAMDICGG